MDERTGRDLNGYSHGMAGRDEPGTGQRQRTTQDTNRNRQPRDASGRFGVTHGAYSRAAGKRRSRRWAHACALYAGYPSWFSTPVPIRFLITSAIRLKAMQDRMFEATFWRGEEPPQPYLTITESLRRHVVALNPESRRIDQAPSLDSIRARYDQREGAAK